MRCREGNASGEGHPTLARSAHAPDASAFGSGDGDLLFGVAALDAVHRDRALA